MTTKQAADIIRMLLGYLKGEIEPPKQKTIEEAKAFEKQGYECLEMAIKALEQQPCEDCISRNDKRTIHTDGLEEGIRCAMCTNPMANDRGCDGGCIVNESMYQNVLNVIKKQILEQEPCEDAVSKFISRQVSLLEERMSSATSEGRWVEEEKCQCAIENLELVDEYIKAHPPVTPQEKTGKWVEGGYEDRYYVCSECDYKASEYWYKPSYKYCPNCGARMVSE